MGGFDEKWKRGLSIGLVVIGLSFLGLSWWLQQCAKSQEVTVGFASLVVFAMGCLCIVGGIILYFVEIDGE